MSDLQSSQPVDRQFSINNHLVGSLVTIQLHIHNNSAVYSQVTL